MKAGDKVVCIENSSRGFFGELGEIYTVEKVFGRYRIKLKESSTEGLDPRRFERLSPVEFSYEEHHESW